MIKAVQYGREGGKNIVMYCFIPLNNQEMCVEVT